MQALREIVVASETGKTSVHVPLPAKWKFRRTRITSFLRDPHPAPIAIVAAGPATASARLGYLAKALTGERPTAAGRPFVVWVLSGKVARHKDADLEIRRILRMFAEPERVEIARSQSALAAVVESLVAKVEVLNERAGASSVPAGGEGHPRRSPLDDLRAIVAATKDLREPSGNLSAQKIADLFGVTVSRIARWLGRTRQAVRKAPDADSLQNQLGDLERIARLRAVLDDPEDFRKWLRMANTELEGRAPLQLLDERRWQVLTDLVEDMLTGSPT